MKVLAYDPQIANHALAELVDDLDGKWRKTLAAAPPAIAELAAP